MNQSPSHLILLFDESGLSYFTGTYVNHLTADEVAYKAWALIDSPDARTLPNPILTDRYAEVFLVYPSSPNLNRYKDLEKQNGTLIYVMRNWSFGEICTGFVQSSLFRSPLLNPSLGQCCTAKPMKVTKTSYTVIFRNTGHRLETCFVFTLVS